MRRLATLPGAGHLPPMLLPVLLADVPPIHEGSSVSLSLAYMVGGAVVVLAVGLAENRFKTAAQDKRQDALEAANKETAKVAAAALADAKRDSEKDRNEIRAKVQVIEVGQAESKVLMSEVRAQLATQAEQGREQTRMLHELLSITSGSARRRRDDKDVA